MRFFHLPKLSQLPLLPTFHLFELLKKKSELISYSVKISALDRYIRDKYWVNLPKKQLLRFIKLSKGDLAKAKKEADEYQERKNGVLVSVKNYLDLLKGGVENDKNTSCYIDSLLFAMFIGLNGFDPLLLSVTKETKIQDHIRLFINKLRKGQLVKAQAVHQLRKALIKSCWEKGYKQEDVHALFLFIANKLNSPKLPVQVNLHHRGKADKNDMKIEKNMCLSLCIPEQSDPIHLEELISKYFDPEIICDIQRQLCSTSLMVKVDAKRTTTLLPFYCSEKNQTPFPTISMIIPLLLMRYTPFGEKNATKIDIPLRLNISRFINKDHRDEKCPVCSSNVEYIMFLRSGICHKGVNCRSGHYISYAKPKEQDH